jgi:hypothetical protein
MAESTPAPYLRQLVEETIGRKSIQWTVPDCGLSSAHRFSVQFDDGRKVFVKAATDEATEQWLRTEHLVLSSAERMFMPRVTAWLNGAGFRPVLLTQDLGNAYWPASHRGVTWRKGDFDLLFEGIKEIASLNHSLLLPPLKNRSIYIWPQIAAEPEFFLSLRLCSEHWFSRAIDALTEAEKTADITGDCVVHGDIRSDNICFAGAHVMFVDWSHAARGSASYDLATLLPTLYLEGGPNPYDIMPDGGGYASLGCAALIKRLVEDHSMPEWLKKVFKKLIGIELEWAAGCLGLEKVDNLP